MIFEDANPSDEEETNQSGMDKSEFLADTLPLLAINYVGIGKNRGMNAEWWRIIHKGVVKAFEFELREGRGVL